MQLHVSKSKWARRLSVLLALTVLASMICLNTSAASSFGDKVVFEVFDFEKETLGSTIWDGPTAQKGEATYKVVNSKTANGGKGLDGIDGQAIEVYASDDPNATNLVFGTHLEKPIDLSAYGDGSYAIKLHIYWDSFEPLYNPENKTITGPDWGVEMTNNGNADMKAYRWNKNVFMPKAGWNTIYLPITAENIRILGLGRIDLSKINFIRFWNTAHNTKYAVLDSVEIVSYTRQQSLKTEGNTMYLENCDDPGNIGALDTTNKKEGFGSAAGLAWNPNQGASVVRTWTTPIDTKTTLATGSIKLWVYVSDASRVKEAQVELTSGGGADRSEINWNAEKLKLKTGWQELTLKFSDAAAHDGATGIPFDPSALNYFRFYATMSKPASLAVDDIRIIKSDGSYTTQAATSSTAEQTGTTSNTGTQGPSGTASTGTASQGGATTNTASTAVESGTEQTTGTESTVSGADNTIVDDNGTTGDNNTTGDSNETASQSANAGGEDGTEGGNSKLPLILLFVGIGVLIIAGTVLAAYFLVFKQKK